MLATPVVLTWLKCSLWNSCHKVTILLLVRPMHVLITGIHLNVFISVPIINFGSFLRSFEPFAYKLNLHDLAEKEFRCVNVLI